MKKIKIRVENLHKTFREEEVLKGIACDFEAGKTHAIVGNNGSGKSVLFKCICGFIKPTEGTITIDDKVIGKDVDFPESMGMIIERPGFLPNMSGFRNLKLLAEIQGKIIDTEIRNTISRVGLDPDSKKAVAKYSLGMKQRLGIAQAIMENPDLLILDEPFNGLDKRGAQDVCELFVELKEKGTTILLAAHNVMEMEWLCDTVCEMDAGQLEVVYEK